MRKITLGAIVFPALFLLPRAMHHEPLSVQPLRVPAPLVLAQARPPAVAQAPVDPHPIDPATPSQPELTPQAEAAASMSPAPAGMKPELFALAVDARQCAIERGKLDPDKALVVIDYDLPSTQKRLWLLRFHGATPESVLRDYVAHGKGSGELWATRFSNTQDSEQTSLGLFRASEEYDGAHGLSVRLDGLDAELNNQARPRGIVLHAAWYADPANLAKDTQRLGRSQGCPAVRAQVLNTIAQDVAGGGAIFAYAAQGNLKSNSRWTHCGS